MSSFPGFGLGLAIGAFAYKLAGDHSRQTAEQTAIRIGEQLRAVLPQQAGMGAGVSLRRRARGLKRQLQASRRNALARARAMRSRRGGKAYPKAMIPPVGLWTRVTAAKVMDRLVVRVTAAGRTYQFVTDFASAPYTLRDAAQNHDEVMDFAAVLPVVETGFARVVA